MKMLVILNNLNGADWLCGSSLQPIRIKLTHSIIRNDQ